MALRLSDGLRSFLMDGGSFKQAFSGGKLQIYSGTQPATGNAASTGTLLATITDASGAHTNEVRSAGSVQLTGGGSGSVDSITIAGINTMDGAVSYDTSLNNTATLVANNINANPKNYLVTASASTDTVTLTAKPGVGTLYNGLAVVANTTTITTTDVNMGTAVAGVDWVNGLEFEQDPTTGILEKLSTQVWTGVGLADGTAGYFRLLGGISDAESADSAEAYFRLDGNIATSGANLNMSSTAVVTSAVQTISTFTVTEPAS